MAPWLGTETTLPMSWHSDATTTSLSAPARSASVAVCRQWVSWSTAKPFTIVDNMRSSCRTVSPCSCWAFIDSTPIWAHSSAVDSSMRVKVCVMSAILRSALDDGPKVVENVTGGDVAVVSERFAREEVPQLTGRWEVLLLIGEADLLDAFGRRQPLDDGPNQLLGRRGPGGDGDRAGEVFGQLVGPVDAQDAAAAHRARHLLEGDGVRRVHRADDDDGVCPLGDIDEC